ncbi:MAG TPA: hypothetical protein VFA81_08170 [Burkholderiales bacterium]|nr:hypothetical protein [Burkholderiales bacterium]
MLKRAMGRQPVYSFWYRGATARMDVAAASLDDDRDFPRAHHPGAGGKPSRLHAPAVAASFLLLLSLLVVRPSYGQVDVDPTGQLADRLSVTVVNLGDDWEKVLTPDSAQQRFALLRLEVQSGKGNESLHPNRLRFNPKRGSAALIAISPDMRTGEATLHEVGGDQRFAMVPLIPRAGGTFQVVYLVDADIEEGVLFFDNAPVGTVRFKR